MATDLATLTSEAQTKRRKHPKQAKPIKPNDDVEVYYRKHLRSLVSAMQRSVERHVLPALQRTKPEYTADAWSDDIESSLEAAYAPFAAAAMEATYQRLARDVVERVTAQTTASLVNSVNQSVGVNLGPVFEQQGMRDFMNVSIQNNVSLIKSISEEHFKNVRVMVYGGVAEKASPTSIADRLQQETGVARRRAELISRDQTAKITSQVQQRRQEQAGIEYFRWVTSKDERVGDDHRAVANRDVGYGKGVFRYDQPPKEGYPGNASRPNCRCTASPVFSWQISDDS